MKNRRMIPGIMLIICITLSLADLTGATMSTTRSISLPAPSATLKEGPGMDTTKRYCSICHSLDYITTQQKFNKSRWQAEVKKMVTVYGAPIPAKEAETIADYIAAHYGN